MGHRHPALRGGGPTPDGAGAPPPRGAAGPLDSPADLFALPWLRHYLVAAGVQGKCAHKPAGARRRKEDNRVASVAALEPAAELLDLSVTHSTVKDDGVNVDVEQAADGGVGTVGRNDVVAARNKSALCQHLSAGISGNYQDRRHGACRFN